MSHTSIAVSAYSNHVLSAQSKVGILLEACSPLYANGLFTDCLAKNSYNEAKCRSQVNALYECCNAFYARNGEKASTVSCPKASLLRLKMRQRAEEMSKWPNNKAREKTITHVTQSNGKFPPKILEKVHKKCDAPSLLSTLSPKVGERKQEASNLLLAIMSAQRGPKDLNKQWWLLLWRLIPRLYWDGRF